MAKFVTIGERLSVTAPTVNKAFAARDEEPILKRAKQQLDAGAVYLDVMFRWLWIHPTKKQLRLVSLYTTVPKENRS